MLSPKLLFSFCSSSVLPLFLCVFSVIILATCDFSCISRLFHVSLQILFIAAPPPPIMDSVLIFFLQPSSWPSSFLDQGFFQQAADSWSTVVIPPQFAVICLQIGEPHQKAEAEKLALKLEPEKCSSVLFPGFCNVFCRRVFCKCLSCMTTLCKTVKTNIAASWKYCILKVLAAVTVKCCSLCA